MTKLYYKTKPSLHECSYCHNKTLFLAFAYAGLKNLNEPTWLLCCQTCEQRSPVSIPIYEIGNEV